jgi:hypothetical protein
MELLRLFSSKIRGVTHAAGPKVRRRSAARSLALTYNPILEGGGVMVGDEVEISVEVELVKTA